MLRPMTLHSTDSTLYALFCLRRHTLPVHSGTLARLTGRSASEIALDLMQLESLGMVVAATSRLTMLGLARAAQLARASGDVSAPHPKPRRAMRRIKPPVAARAQADSDETLKKLSA
jgi:hypothetical protein